MQPFSDDVLGVIVQFLESKFVLSMYSIVSHQWRQISLNTKLSLSLTHIQLESLSGSPLFENVTNLALHPRNEESMEPLLDILSSITHKPTHLTKLEIEVYDKKPTVCELFNGVSSCDYLSNLTYLGLHGYMDDYEGAKLLASSPNLNNLQSLVLRCFRSSTHGDIQAILSSESMPNLTLLDLHKSKICETGAKLIASNKFMKNLKHLNLYQAHINYAGVQAIASSEYMSNLTHLNVGNNGGCGDEGAISIWSSPYLSNLTSLHLNNTSTGLEWAKTIHNHCFMSNLTFLDLSLNPICHECVQAICSVPYLSNLTHLDLYGLGNIYRNNNVIGVEGAKAIGNSLYFDKLLHLNLKYCLIGDEGIESITLNQNFQSITDLNISFNNITDVGVMSMFTNSFFANLTSLNLEGNTIGNRGIETIFYSSVTIPNLSRISLARNRISSSQLEMICSSPLITKLELLDLSNTYITNDSTRFICLMGSLPLKLKELNLYGTELSKASVDKISKALSHIRKLKLPTPESKFEKFCFIMYKCCCCHNH